MAQRKLCSACNQWFMGSNLGSRYRWKNCHSVAHVLATINGENPCRYVDSAGIIDLTSLGHTDGTPAFPDISQSASSWMQYCDRVVSFSEYSFNPCKPFTEGTTCKDVAVCQVPFTSGESFILAKHDSAVWIPPIGFGGSATLTYTYQTKHTNIERCNKQHDLVSIVCEQDFRRGEKGETSSMENFRINYPLTSDLNGCKHRVSNAFVTNVFKAYYDHYPLEPSVDDFWVTIIQGKKELIVSADDLRISDAERPKHEAKSVPGVDWESVVRMIAELIRKNMKTDLASLITKPFLTTKPVEQAVFNCALMDATKPYYSYGVTLLCGIPEVTLRGSQGDFQQIIDSIN
ncbi:unnamed protein product [Rotaria socialis]|uniref:Uncharacterized protein n=1 Tax=Rotaria socialis TaxID=392032 RepID=A0A820SD43_9BILA|nr:unnamed protein product [Rotaria socialis]